MKFFPLLLFLAFCFASCQTNSIPENKTQPTIKISKENYLDKFEGFWLGSCIANWTGLITEMDKIGNIGEIKTGPFYTRANWGGPDQPNIWSGDTISSISPVIDFVLIEDDAWGADDDTDIEYMYQYLLDQNDTSILTAEQIRTGWLNHIKKEEENYLWVSNQRAFDLMREGILPPATSDPAMNEHFDMIDAQLTTEIFGLYAPGRPDIGLQIAHLPIRTTANKEAVSIAEFYVTMYSLAALPDSSPINERVIKMADKAREGLPESTYPAKMYDYVKALYVSNIPWEQARDSIYFRYQVDQRDGYDITSRNLYCNGCFAAGINFAASLVSLFYGQGDFAETVKIGTLCGWDSDNPTATWGGMLGFMIGKKAIEEMFKTNLSDQFNIHRTRQNFPNEGLDNFRSMAESGIRVTEKVIKDQMNGKIDTINNMWIIPL